METDSQPQLNERLQSGDAETAEAVFNRYANQLVRVAEQHLSRKVASRLGSDDVVQSVFRTFFRRAEAGQFRIDSSGQLWRLLVRITVMKARAKGRHHTAGKRAANVEADGDGDALLADAIGREPNPAEAAELVDQIESLLHDLPAEYARVLELRLSGDSVTDVAAELGMSRQSVYRMLNYLQDKLVQLDPSAKSFVAEPDPEPTA